MRLSELVDLRERLKKSFDLEPVLESVDTLRLNIGLVNQNVEAKYSDMLDGLIAEYREIRQSVQTPTGTVQTIIDEINKTLSTRQGATVDTSLRKLQSVMRNNVNTNYGYRQRLAQKLADKGDSNLMEALAASPACRNES